MTGHAREILPCSAGRFHVVPPNQGMPLAGAARPELRSVLSGRSGQRAQNSERAGSAQIVEAQVVRYHPQAR